MTQAHDSNGKKSCPGAVKISSPGLVWWFTQAPEKLVPSDPCHQNNLSGLRTQN